MKCKHPFELISCVCNLCGKDISEEFKIMQKRLTKAEKVIRWYATDSEMVNSPKCFIDCGQKARDYFKELDK